MYTFKNVFIKGTAQMFSFLYRVFYDRTLFFLYVKKGKGYGFKPLFFLVVFMAFCLAGRVFWLFSSISPQLVEEFVAQVPEIVFEKGIITVPENYRYSYVSKAGNLFFVFDTKSAALDLKNLPPVGLYVSKDAMITVRQNELRRVPFVNILKKVDFTLNQENIRSAINEMVSLTKIFIPPIVFVVYFPFFFSAFFMMSLLFFLLSFLMTHFVKMLLNWKERLRLVVLSIIPAGVINGVGILLNTDYFLKSFFNIGIVLVYMYCLLKDGQNAGCKA